MEYIRHVVSPLGVILLACDDEGVTGLWFEGQKHFACGLSPECLEEGHPFLGQAADWLDIYFSGREPDFLPPLCPRGTPFQLAVWQLLREIPYGSTATYGQLTAKLPAGQGSPRSVGGAAGRNPISLLIPCHRLVGAGGNLTGYAGGIERKRRLLELERGLVR